MNEGASAAEESQQQEGAWKPNPEFLESLMNMGIQRAAAETVRFFFFYTPFSSCFLYNMF
jgi:hypothetical protein